MPSQVKLGNDEWGICFHWAPNDPNVKTSGELSIDIWYEKYCERAWIELDSHDALQLAQWINEVLDRD